MRVVRVQDLVRPTGQSLRLNIGHVDCPHGWAEAFFLDFAKKGIFHFLNLILQIFFEVQKCQIRSFGPRTMKFRI